jgi:hypothetical protein
MAISRKILSGAFRPSALALATARADGICAREPGGAIQDRRGGAL